MADSVESVYDVMESIVEPLLRADGGKLYISALSQREAVLHVRGTFAGCPGNTLVIRRVIEPALHAVAPGCRVTVSAGELLPEAARPWEEFRVQVKRP